MAAKKAQEGMKTIEQKVTEGAEKAANKIIGLRSLCLLMFKFPRNGHEEAQEGTKKF